MSEIDVRQKGYDYDTLRRLWSEWRQIGSTYYGDYYPLTAFSRKTDVWMAWQFNNHEKGDGVIEAFRRPGSEQEVMNLKLRGLNPEGKYRFSVIDGPTLDTSELTGRQLMSIGLPVRLRVRPEVAVIKYERL